MLRSQADKRQGLDRLDPGEGRGFVLQARPETRNRLTEQIDGHALAVIVDRSGQAELCRQPVHERPEADALHDARHAQPGACRRTVEERIQRSRQPAAALIARAASSQPIHWSIPSPDFVETLTAPILGLIFRALAMSFPGSTSQ